jgi:serine/threonine protein kinase
MEIHKNPEQARKMALDIAVGMSEIHNIGVVHFDLKPGNILIEKLEDHSMRCIICDFGFAAMIGSDKGRKITVSGLQTPENGGFTPNYAAPELFSRIYSGRTDTTEADKAVDVYAYAMTLYQLITQEKCYPCMNNQEIEEAVLNGIRPPFSSETLEIYSQHVILNIIKDCWQSDPQARPTFIEISKRLQETISE